MVCMDKMVAMFGIDYNSSEISEFNTYLLAPQYLYAPQ